MSLTASDSSLQAEHGTTDGVPVWKRWWFWTGVGVVAASAVTLVLLKTRDECPVAGGCERISAPR